MGSEHKHDAGKSRLDLVPFRALIGVGHVLRFGAEKYEPWGWRRVEDARYVAAAMRHIAAHALGEVIDDESGLPHIDHAIASLMFISERLHEARR